MQHYRFNIDQWVLDTLHLTVEEEVTYFRLMNHYYLTEKPIPVDTGDLVKKLRLNGSEVEAVLSEKFRLAKDGWHHPEWDAKIAAVGKYRANGLKGGRPKKPKRNQNETKTKPKHNQSITKNEILVLDKSVDKSVDNSISVDKSVDNLHPSLLKDTTNIDMSNTKNNNNNTYTYPDNSSSCQSLSTIDKQSIGKSKKFTEDDFQIATAMATHICSQFKSVNPNLDHWADAIRKLREIEKLSSTEIQGIWQWAQDDEFWSQQIRTPIKLRKRNRDGIKYYEVIQTRQREVSNGKTRQPTTESFAAQQHRQARQALADLDDIDGEVGDSDIR